MINTSCEINSLQFGPGTRPSVQESRRLRSSPSAGAAPSSDCLVWAESGLDCLITGHNLALTVIYGLDCLICDRLVYSLAC